MKAMLSRRVEQTNPFLKSLPEEVRASWLGPQVRVSGLQLGFFSLLWTDYLVLNLLQTHRGLVMTTAKTHAKDRDNPDAWTQTHGKQECCTWDFVVV